MKYRAYGTVVGSKFIGEFKADTPAEAHEKAMHSEGAYVSLCHQCDGACEDPEVTRIVIEADNEERDTYDPDDPENEVVKLALCESKRLALKPNVTYRFTVDDDCKECKRLAEKAETP